MIRNVLLAAILAALPAFAAAQDNGTAFYGEVGIGLSVLPDAETEPFAIDVGPGILAGSFQNEFSSVQGMFEAELGLATGQWRFAIGHEWTKATIDSAAFSGTFNGNPLNIDLSKDDLEGLDINTELGLWTVGGNVYYSFAPARSAVEPYIGLGAGAAIIKNASTELAFSAAAGARFAISPNAYFGARYRFTHISGSEDSAGIKYENVMLHTLSVQLGIYLGSF